MVFSRLFRLDTVSIKSDDYSFALDSSVRHKFFCCCQQKRGLFVCHEC
jgi:hypothetical protein